MNSFRRLENHSPSVDLRYYALSFQEKEREAKRREKESLNAIAEKEILKIKKTPWTAFAGNRGIVNEKSIDDVEDESANDYFVDLLNCNHLLTIKGIRLRNFQLLRLLFSSSSRDSNNEKINPHSEKSTALSNFISIFRNVARYIGNVTHIFYRRCIYFIYRAVGLYYCFKLSNHVQRLIVPLKDIKLLKKIHTSDHRIIYFLENPSLYHIMLLIYLFYWNDIEMPAIYFRADDKTRIWWILRNMGVTIIDLEALIGIEDGIFDYKKLQAQIENLFERKKAIAFFSKLSYTNSGVDDLVRVIMKANSCNCVVSDVILATVNFSSENVPFNCIENSLFLKKAAKYSYNFFKNNFGIVQVKIGTPFSLKEIIASSHITSHSQTISRTDVITKNVVTRLNFEFSRSRILMSTHLVSFIMLYKFRDGVKFVDLVKTVDALRNKLTLRKNCLLGFSGTTENVVKHAIKILDKKLEVVQTNIECIIKPVLTLPDVLDLFRLSAVALDYFILDAAIMTCIQVQFKSVLEDAFKSDKNTLTFYYNDFVEKIEQLCEILQVQFSFQGPNQNLSNEISNALFKYVELECFVKNEKFLTDEERWGHRFAKHLESDDEDDSYYTRNRGDTYSVKFDTNPDLYQEIIFFHKCLQPIIETYVVVFDNLAILLKEPIIHQELVKQTFFTLKSYFDDGRLKYPESVSLELVLKSIELLEISNNLKSYTVDEIKIYYLNKENDGSTNLHDIEYKLRYFQR